MPFLRVLGAREEGGLGLGLAHSLPPLDAGVNKDLNLVCASEVGAATLAFLGRIRRPPAVWSNALASAGDQKLCMAGIRSSSRCAIPGIKCAKAKHTDRLS